MFLLSCGGAKGVRDEPSMVGGLQGLLDFEDSVAVKLPYGHGFGSRVQGSFEER